MGGGEEVRDPVKHYYYGQGGWYDFTWGGVWRTIFVFSDSLQSGRSLFAGQGEGKIAIGNAAGVAELLPKQYFAGIVCVAD